MAIPPGLIQILYTLRYLVLLLSVPFVSNYYFGLQLSNITFAIACLLGYPVFILCNSLYWKAANRIEAARLGAVLPPDVKEWPWTIFHQRVISSAAERDYLGMFMTSSIPTSVSTVTRPAFR